MSAATDERRLAFLDGERRRSDAALERVLVRLLAGVSPAVASPIRHALNAGGKRLRPILCVCAFTAVRQRDGAGNGAVGAVHGCSDDAGAARPDALYDLAAGIELLHTYSLIHDDLPCMDDDDLRRGMPTAHRVFGVHAAAAAGAALIPLAARALEEGGRALGLAAEQRRASIAELARAAGGGGMVGGQQLDLEAEGAALDIGELHGVHARKTGALFAAAARIGGIAAGGGDDAVAALGRYGECLGLAFQIADDVLDETGSAAVLGKQAGRDRERDKVTFPGLLGVDAARQRAAAAASEAVDALRAAGLATATLAELARHAAERDR